jgi:hypothetical protein
MDQDVSNNHLCKSDIISSDKIENQEPKECDLKSTNNPLQINSVEQENLPKRMRRNTFHKMTEIWKMIIITKELRLKLVLIILYVLIDIGISIGAAVWYFIEFNDIDFRLCNHSDFTLVYSTACLGEQPNFSRWTTGSIYFISVILGLLIILSSKLIKFDLARVLNNDIIKAVYILRNVCLFNYLSIVSYYDENNGQNVLKFVDIGSQLFMRTCTIPLAVTSLILITWKDYFYTFIQFEEINKIIISWILIFTTVYGIILSIAIYIINVGALDVNILIMYDSRGPGLSTLNILQYSLLLITILEFYELLRMRIILKQKRNRNDN